MKNDRTLCLKDFKNLSDVCIHKDKYFVIEHIYFMNKISKKGNFECSLHLKIIHKRDFENYDCVSISKTIPEIQKKSLFI